MVGYTIGRTMSETDGIPEEWVRRCNLMDEVWVPTEFHRKIFEDSGVAKDKIVVVPEPVDTDFFSPEAATEIRFLSSIKAFKFLAVAKWEERKNFKTLVKVFTEEFSADDDVALIVLTHEFHHEGLKNIYISNQHVSFLFRYYRVESRFRRSSTKSRTP